MLKNKCKKGVISCIIICTVSIVLIISAVFLYFNADLLHLERITPLRPLILQLNIPISVPAYFHTDPITWDTIDTMPEWYPDGYWWFNSVNNYTRKQLKRYMKENDLYIVPKLYHINCASDISELLEILEFKSVLEIEK